MIPLDRIVPASPAPAPVAAAPSGRPSGAVDLTTTADPRTRTSS